MYEYHNNVLCVKGGMLIEQNIIGVNLYKRLTQRGFLNVLRRGGNGRTALVEFHSMREDIKQKVIQLAGDPTQTAQKTIFESYMQPDYEAAAFFTAFRKSNGKPLPKEKQLEYTTNAIILNAIDTIVISKASNRSKVTGNTKRLWENISNAINQLPSNQYSHSIPGNHRSVERLFRKFKSVGYSSLVHGGIENENRVKITGEIADFLLATYCQPNKPLIPTVLALYDQIRISKGWTTLSESAIYNFLERPENKRIWMLARHGKETYSNMFQHKLSRDRSEWFPNAYWAIDGTKLDWVHYQDHVTGMAAKLKINPVFDVYSEMIIGYSLSETENHVDHFTALKSALNFTQARPYKLTYDNQSGHKSSRMQELYSGIIAKQGGVHNPTAPRMKSNPAEQIFNRLQEQVISTFWFSDKQSVKSRSKDNVPNIDFILANKHRLLSKDELVSAWELAVSMWNNAAHPLIPSKTRAEVYAAPAPMSESVDFLDMIDLFWINETKPITYKNDGLHLRIAGQEYIFEVYDKDDKVDLNFRRYNIGKKFIVRYDPEQLDSYIQLIEVAANGDKTLVAHAQPKRAHQEIPVLMTEGDKEAWFEDYSIREKELQRDLEELEALRNRTGITPEKLIDDQEWMIKMGSTLPKDTRSDVESDSVFTYL